MAAIKEMFNKLGFELEELEKLIEQFLKKGKRSKKSNGDLGGLIRLIETMEYEIIKLIKNKDVKSQAQLENLRENIKFSLNEFNQLQKSYLQDMDKTMHYVNKVIYSTKINKILNDLENAKGFKRIAGYEKQKNYLL